MCLLILLRTADPDFPLILAGNRDERRDRKAAPPGLFVGEHRRMLSPRDRVADGTWLALGETGMVAGLTNLASGASVSTDTTRGELPHLAVDAGDLDAAVAAVVQRCAAALFQPFQLLLADRERAVVLVNNGGIEVDWLAAPMVVLTNEHRVGELELPDARALQDPSQSHAARIERLQSALVDTGARSGHPILKKGAEYGTVSSSIVAVPAEGVLGSQWWYAIGEPDVAPYKNYGNLAKRLV